MKHFLIFCICIVIAGCGTMKKISKTYNSEIDKKTATEKISDSSVLIDTTKVDGKVISVIKVEFSGDTPVVEKDTIGSVAPTVPSNTIETNGTKITGNIKSAEIIKIDEKKEEKGVTSTTVSTTDKATTEDNTINNIKEDNTPVKDPRRFMWLAILIAVILVAFLIVYYKFLKPLGIGSKIVGFFGKITNLFK